MTTSNGPGPAIQIATSYSFEAKSKSHKREKPIKATFSVDDLSRAHSRFKGHPQTASLDDVSAPLNSIGETTSPWPILSQALIGKSRAQEKLLNMAQKRAFQINWNAVAPRGSANEAESALLVLLRCAAKGMPWAEKAVSTLFAKQGLTLYWNAKPQKGANQANNALYWLICLAFRDNEPAQQKLIELSSCNYTLFDWQAKREQKTRLIKWGIIKDPDDLHQCPTPFWAILLGVHLDKEWAKTALAQLLKQNPKNIDWNAHPVSGKFEQLSGFGILIELIIKGKSEFFEQALKFLQKDLDFMIKGRHAIHVLLTQGFVKEALLLTLAYPQASTIMLNGKSKRTMALEDPVLGDLKRKLNQFQAVKKEAVEKFQHYLETIQLQYAERPMPTDVTKIIGVKLIVSMLKDSLKDVSPHLIEQALLHSVDFSTPTADSKPALTEKFDRHYESQSYQVVVTKGKKIVAEHTQLSQEKIGSNIVCALRDLKEQQILPAFLNKQRRSRTLNALSKVTNDPSKENIQSVIYKDTFRA